jgi:DNA end-binding protein Ku
MWRGVISLGMITIPVRLFVATESHSVSFRQLCAEHVSLIRNKRWCDAGGHEVPYAEVARGYEVSPDQYVVIEDSDLENLPQPTARMIAITSFLPDDAIKGGLFFKSAYYVEPETVARKAYRLLTQALVDTGMMAIARIAFRDREHLCCLHAVKDLLLLNTLHWPDEIRPPERLPMSSDLTIRPRELQMAKSLVQNLAVDTFDPRRYRDEYSNALMHAVNVKVEGGEVVRASQVEVAPVMNLMEALMASVKAARKQRASQQDSAKNTRRGKASTA